MKTRIFQILLVLSICAFASATIKDPRKNVKLRPELSQSVVSQQQKDQRKQGEVGIVESKTDEVRPDVMHESSEAKNAIAMANPVDESNPNGTAAVLTDAEKDLQAKAGAGTNTAFSFLWWLIGAALIVGGFIYSLNRFAPGPGEKPARPATPSAKSVKF